MASATEKIKTIRLEGMIKGEKSLELGRELAALEHQVYKKVIIDFRRVTYIDSSGLGALLYYRAVFEKEGIDLALTVSSGVVEKCFRDCRLEEVFTIVKG